MIRREEQRNFEKNVVRKVRENEKFFLHKFMRSKLSFKEQLIKGYSLGRIVEDDVKM